MAEPLALCIKDIQQQELWLHSWDPTQLDIWLCLKDPHTALILECVLHSKDLFSW